MRRITAAVLVDDAVEVTEQAGKRTTTRRKRTAEEMKQIEQLAQAAIGVDAQRGDVLAVENLSFQEAPIEAPPAPPAGKRTLAQPARALGLGVALRRAGGAVSGDLLAGAAPGEEASCGRLPTASRPGQRATVSCGGRGRRRPRLNSRHRARGWKARQSVETRPQR